MKNLLNLMGAQQLSASEQMTIKGGVNQCKTDNDCYGTRQCCNGGCFTPVQCCPDC